MEVDSILPASLTYGQQIGVPSSPVPVSAAPTITAFSNLFFDAMSPEPAPVRPLKRILVSPRGSRATSVRQRHSNEGEFIHVPDPSSSSAPPHHLPHGNLNILRAPVVSFGSPINFLIVIQETPLRASGPDAQLSQFLEVRSLNQHTPFSSLRGRMTKMKQLFLLHAGHSQQ